jgi:hypothetical protein
MVDISLHHPFTCMVSGPTKAGKTVWTKRFVQHAKELMDPPPERIIWCYSEYQDGYNTLGPDVELMEGIPELQTLKQCPKRKLLILDDFMAELSDKKNSSLVQLFSCGSHHWNCSCIYIVRNLFHGGRMARVNAHYIVLMKNPSDQLQAMTLAKQIYPGKHKFFLEAYKDACTSKPYGYLLVDVSPQSHDETRLRTNIFPGELAIAYLPKM